MEDLNNIPMGLADETVSHKALGVFTIMFTRMTADMKFVGIFTIIYGGLTCLSIIGALIGVPLIIAGLRIREAADEFTVFQSSNDSKALRRALEKQAKYFNILKILIIVALVLTVIYIIVMISMIGTFLTALNGGNFS